MGDTIRIRNLLDMPALGTSLIAGTGGLARAVLWAHSCEMPDPAQWLGPDELLMTVGLCVPTDPADQVAFIGRLDDGGLAGLAIGDELLAPPISPVMLEEADRRDFPVLLISHKVPFVAIGRTVAAANSSILTQQMLTLNRLYRVLIDRAEAQEPFLVRLEKIFGVRMCVLDLSTAAILLPGSLAPDDKIAGRVRQKLHLDGPGNPDPHRQVAGDEIRIWKIPSRHEAVLALDEQGGTMLDSFTALHLRDAVAVEVDRLMAAKLGLIARGTQLMASLLSGQVRPENASPAATDLGLTGPAFSVLAVPADGSDDLALMLAVSGIANASAAHQGHLVCWLNSQDADAACELLLPLCERIGVSAAVPGIRDVLDAIRAAGWALGSIREGERRVAHYADTALSLLPRSAGEAREVVRKVLGPLFPESGEGTPLFDTLRCFLEKNRDWAATAAALGIHRQTLAYRLRRIEAETGRSLKSTRDLSEMWIACAATDFL